MKYTAALLFMVNCIFTNLISAKPFTIMIDPAGDAKYAGRSIGDYFERGLTLSFANALKEDLEKQYPHLRIILTRLPGETLEPLQNANFANRLSIDLYINIHFFALSTEAAPTIYTYYVMHNPVTDIWQQNNESLSFIPLTDAHRIALKITQQWAQQALHILQKKVGQQCAVQGPFGIPFKPLTGIAAPSYAFEIGLKRSNDWKQYVEPLICCIGSLIGNNA